MGLKILQRLNFLSVKLRNAILPKQHWGAIRKEVAYSENLIF